jgi:flagellar motility protein MotE (MotC chaperone)
MKVKSRVLWLLFGVCFVGATAATVMSDDGVVLKSESSDETAENHGAAGGSCIPSQAAIDDLSQQRELLQARERELAAKEAELKALEQSVSEEFKKLEQVRAEIAKIDNLRKKESQEKVAKIVETVETMSPKPASALLSALDESLAVTAMEQMSTAKLAKIMNIMESGRSSRLTELLAGVVRARGASLASNAGSRVSPSNDGAATAKTSVKGGDVNDGQNKQQTSGGAERAQRQPGSGQKGQDAR